MSLKNNPFINRPKYKHGAVPFNDIELEHFIPALDYAITKAEKNLEFIIKNIFIVIGYVILVTNWKLDLVYKKLFLDHLKDCDPYHGLIRLI